MKFRPLLSKHIFMTSFLVLLVGWILPLNSSSTEPPLVSGKCFEIRQNLCLNHVSALRSAQFGANQLLANEAENDLGSCATPSDIARYILFSKTRKELESFNGPYENHKIFLH